MKLKDLTLNQMLLVIAAVLVLFFMLTAAIGVITGRISSSQQQKVQDPTPEKVLAEHPYSSAFDLLGQIRAPTKLDVSDRKAVVVVTPWLEYDGNDGEFYEELQQKSRSIKAVFASYISSRTEEQLEQEDESLIKNNILEEINSELMMGKIKAIYFKQYEILK